MPGLYLRCVICSRQQAEGLISGAGWGRLELSDGSTLRVCPSCVSEHADWQTHLLAWLEPDRGQASA
jgi:hypothetical protein